jgi:hypothetical protein
MQYWTGLYAGMDKEWLAEGVNTMIKVAKEILASQQAGQAVRRQLKDGDKLNYRLKTILPKVLE